MDPTLFVEQMQNSFSRLEVLTDAACQTQVGLFSDVYLCFFLSKCSLQITQTFFQNHFYIFLLFTCRFSSDLSLQLYIGFFNQYSFYITFDSFFFLLQSSCAYSIGKLQLFSHSLTRRDSSEKTRIQEKLPKFLKADYGCLHCIYIMTASSQLILCSGTFVSFTDRNILEDSYQLVKHFSAFQLWEYTIASFKQKLLIKRSNSVLPEQEIQKMFYLLVGILQNISINVSGWYGQKSSALCVLLCQNSPQNIV